MAAFLCRSQVMLRLPLDCSSNSLVGRWQRHSTSCCWGGGMADAQQTQLKKILDQKDRSTFSQQARFGSKYILQPPSAQILSTCYNVLARPDRPINGLKARCMRETGSDEGRVLGTKAVATPESSTNGLELTKDNVESVLDEVRPYLMSDGGNVALHEIDGLVVKLKLQGACGSCPSSLMTMKMGIERRLIERIPEIVGVEQVMDEETGLALSEENVEKVLSEIRPILLAPEAVNFLL